MTDQLFVTRLVTNMSALPFVVHPQAILQIADHTTRSQFFGPQFKYICGFILGSSDGPKIEIHSAFEANIIEREDGLRLDRESFRIMRGQHQKIYPGEVVIGWYTCRAYDDATLMALAEVFEGVEHTDSLIRGEFLPDGDKLLTIYVNKNEEWIPVEYNFESELAERIAMMQLQSEGNAESQVQFTADAFKSLDHHLEIIENYLTQMAEGAVPFDPVIARKCADIAQWWTHKNNGDDENKVIEQENLALLVGLLAETLAGFESKNRK